MDRKRLDITKSVYELCSEHPELPEILAGIGFQDILKPGMLQTAGRFMTLAKGAALKKIGLDAIRKFLTEKGYDVIG